MRRRVLSAVVLCGLGVAGCGTQSAGSAPVAVHLAYVLPTKKTTTHYTVKATMNESVETSAAGAQDIKLKSSGDITEVISPSKGGYAISMAYSQMTARLNGIALPDTALNGVTATFLTDASGHVLSVHVTPDSSAAQALASTLKSAEGSLFPHFPKKALKPGDSWTAHRTVTLGSVSTQATTTYTYLGLSNGELKVKMSGKPTLHGTLSGTETVTGYLYLDPTTYLSDGFSLDSSYSGTVTLPSASGSSSPVTIHMTMQMSMRRT